MGLPHPFTPTTSIRVERGRSGSSEALPDVPRRRIERRPRHPRVLAQDSMMSGTSCQTYAPCIEKPRERGRSGSSEALPDTPWGQLQNPNQESPHSWAAHLDIGRLAPDLLEMQLQRRVASRRQAAHCGILFDVRSQTHATVAHPTTNARGQSRRPFLRVTASNPRSRMIIAPTELRLPDKQ